MIVVAIIALLASIAAPNFLRARKRSQATATIQTALNSGIVDAAKDQYAIENNKFSTTTPLGVDLQPYVKKDSRLHIQLGNEAVLDEINNAITIGAVDTAPKITVATRAALDDALSGIGSAATDGFWGSFKP